ncbi:MAG: glycosyltransferase [Pelovirga sp.]
MLVWPALLILVFQLLIAVEVLRGSRRLIALEQITPVPSQRLPSLSIIAAARNEERNIAAALTSLLLLDYPQLELVLVNDRSTDRTQDIVAAIAAQDERLTILQIDELPPGWLGKNHALWRGSQLASGELLLFTDADIIMAPQTLRHAVSLLLTHQLDHLTLSPAVRMPGMLLNLLGATFGLFFGLHTRPWRVTDRHSACHIGIGAFNLVRADAYHQVGGHRTICLRPDDDLKLGKIIKKAGFRQQFAYGERFIQVQWYASLREMVVGLEKNLFAGTDYRIGLTCAGLVASLLLFVWPYLALLSGSGATRLLSLLTVLTITLVVVDSSRRHGFSPWYAAGLPVAVLLLCGVAARTMILNLVQGGITWRGTFYPLRELRKNRV